MQLFWQDLCEIENPKVSSRKDVRTMDSGSVMWEWKASNIFSLLWRIQRHLRERFNRLSDPHAGLNTADRAPVVPPAPVLNIQTETEVNYAWFAFALRRPPRAPPDTSATDPIGFVCALQFVLMREKLSFWLRCSLQDRTRFNLCSRLSGSLREDKDKPLTLWDPHMGIKWAKQML